MSRDRDDTTERVIKLQRLQNFNTFVFFSQHDGARSVPALSPSPTVSSVQRSPSYNNSTIVFPNTDPIYFIFPSRNPQTDFNTFLTWSHVILRFSFIRHPVIEL